MKSKLQTFLMFLSLALTVSCGKDYNALFQERITELNKEGKYILNQYNDSVGKEHYIVYIDVDKIVVDTLGDSLQVYPLNVMEHFQYRAKTDNNGKFVFEKEITPKSTLVSSAQVNLKNKEMVIDKNIFLSANVKFKDIKCVGKDCAYVNVKNPSGNNNNTYIFFFNKPRLLYVTYGNYHSTIFNGKSFDIVDKDPLVKRGEGLYDQKFEYKAKMSTKGEIIQKDDYITVAGEYKIPVSSYASGEMDSYYAKIAADLKPTYYWNCQNCYKVVKSESKPESGFCESNFFTGSMSTWTIHSWVRLCKAGSLHTYQCQDCGVQVKTNDVPQMGACRYGANHVWNQLQ